MNHPQTLISTITNRLFVFRQILVRKLPLGVRELVDWVGSWLADNARSFYLLPDSVELMLYVFVIIYLASKFAQQA
ncbi:MAG TPA: hypothetical protein VLV18_06880 [Terriglobales bacterium]|nr:hypothetical protein [Terriglobales bacterium]